MRDSASSASPSEKPSNAAETSDKEQREREALVAAIEARKTRLSEAPWMRFWLISGLIAQIILITDLITKRLAMGSVYLDIHHEKVIIPGFFSLVDVRNPGAAWGILEGHMKPLALISLLVFIGVVVFYRKLVDGWPERSTALGLLMGGIVGNLIDRVFYEGGVVDFLDFYIGTYHWPAFNIADSAICVGLFLYVISSFVRPEPVPLELPPDDDGKTRKQPAKSS